ncbi:MAG: transcriptional regulator NrdR [Alphaproteobacteria bacterium]|nr:transcriptional regulator NrdR [Alphaproteobacteria bacterium]
MRCPFCGHEDSQVKDSRPADDGSAIRRRRECPSCGGRFTTFERVQLRDLLVLKNNGSKELFDREKLIRSLRTPLRKRPVTGEQIERAVNGIVRQLETSVDGEVTSKRIGELVMQALANLDQVAYVRYASVYRDFKEVTDFRDFLGSMKKEASK